MGGCVTDAVGLWMVAAGFVALSDDPALLIDACRVSEVVRSAIFSDSSGLLRSM